jgi:hypothetical protein
LEIWVGKKQHTFKSFLRYFDKKKCLQGSHYFEIRGRSDFSFMCRQKRSETQQGEVVRVQVHLSARQNKESEKGLFNTNKQKTNTRIYRVCKSER